MNWNKIMDRGRAADDSDHRPPEDESGPAFLPPWQAIKLILAREIRDQLRDRRTLFVIAVLPILLYPLLGMSVAHILQFRGEQPTRVLIVGVKNLPQDPRLIEGLHFTTSLYTRPERAALMELTLLQEEAGDTEGREAWQKARKAVESGQFETALYFSPDFAARLDRCRRSMHAGVNWSGYREPVRTVPSEPLPRPEVCYSSANEKSQITFARVWELLQRWNEKVIQANLVSLGIPPSTAAPVDPSVEDVAENSSYKGAAIWSKVLPVILLIWALSGAFYPAVDLCAGEKERGTLETLLCSPALRSEIVLGKLLTIMLFSAATALLNLISMVITAWMVLGHYEGFGPPPLLSCLWMLVALVPASALFSALSLALAAFARSSKEGQYYLIPLLVVTMPLTLFPAMPGVELTLGTSLIPVTGIVLVLRAVLEGNYAQAFQFLPPVLAVTAVCCALAIHWAIDQFNTESVLFREGERFHLGHWVRHVLRNRRATPRVGGALCCGMIILMVRFLIGLAGLEPVNFAEFAWVAVVTQLAAVVLPTLLLTLVLTRSARQTLLFRRSRRGTLLAAILLAVVIQPIVNLIAAGVMHLYPFSEEITMALESTQRILKDVSLEQAILVLAVLPAVGEELAFRGFILSGLRHLGRPWRAIVLSAIFFGLTHSILQQSLVACLVGVVLGLVAVRSGSLLPCIAFHLIHNSLQLVAAQMPGHRNDWSVVPYLIIDGPADRVTYTWPVVVASGLASAAIGYWFLRRNYRKSVEEMQQERIARKRFVKPAAE